MDTNVASKTDSPKYPSYFIDHDGFLIPKYEENELDPDMLKRVKLYEEFILMQKLTQQLYRSI